MLQEMLSSIWQVVALRDAHDGELYLVLYLPPTYILFLEHRPFPQPKWCVYLIVGAPGFGSVAKQPPQDNSKGRFTSTTQALRFSSVLSSILSPVRLLVSSVLTTLQEKPKVCLQVSRLSFVLTCLPTPLTHSFTLIRPLSIHSLLLVTPPDYFMGSLTRCVYKYYGSLLFAHLPSPAASFSAATERLTRLLPPLIRLHPVTYSS